MGQGSLFDERADTIERLIVVLMLPDPAVRAAQVVLEKARETEGLGGKAIDGERLHVTLIHVGDYANAIPPSVIADVRRALDGLSLSLSVLVFDQAGSFGGAPGKHPYVLLGGDALKDARTAIWEALAKAGVRMLSKRDFNPHVTLAYGDRVLPERAIEPIRWRAGEILLVHSEYGRSNYITLGRWPLGEAT